MDQRLPQAHESYAAQDFLRAFALCKEVLDEEPDCVEALVLFAQLCLTAGEYLTAMQCLRLAEHIDPQQTPARTLLADNVANDAYREILELDPGLGIHTSAHFFARGVPQMPRLETTLREIIALRPDHAAAHASLGNLLGRTGRLSAGLDAYARALSIDPHNAAVRLGYAERLRLNAQNDRAREHLERALKQTRIYEEPASGAQELRLLTLCAPDFWENNILVDLLVDRERVHVSKYFVGGNEAAPAITRPVFCAVADPQNTESLVAAGAISKNIAARILNEPALLARTARTYLSENPPIGSDLLIPRAVAANAAAVNANSPPVEFPLLIRPADSHRGVGLALVRDEDQLRGYLAAAGSLEVVITAFVDYASPDAYYRKYRFIFVNGRPLPYHLAISPQWMVHYFSAPMEKHRWMRLEEAAFLAQPTDVFSGRLWNGLLALRDAIGLDYFGLDCAVFKENVLVFEANANMLVQNFYDERLFGYKRPAYEAIAAEFNAMIRERRSLP